MINGSFWFQDTWTKVLITIHTETCEDLNIWSSESAPAVSLSDTMGSLSLIHTRIWHKTHKDKGRKSVKVLGLWEGLLPAVLAFLSVGFLQHFSHGGIKWECWLEIIWPDLPGAAGLLLHWVSSGFIESSFKALQGQRCLSEQLFMCCITILVKKEF